MALYISLLKRLAYSQCCSVRKNLNIIEEDIEALRFTLQVCGKAKPALPFLHVCSKEPES